MYLSFPLLVFCGLLPSPNLSLPNYNGITQRDVNRSNGLIISNTACENWKLWLHELIDWSQREQGNPLGYSMLYGNVEPSHWIVLENSEVGVAVSTLARVMGVDGNPTSTIFLPEASIAGKERLAELFLQLDEPLWAPSLRLDQKGRRLHPYWDVPHLLRFQKASMSGSAFEKKQRVGTLVYRDEMTVRHWIDDFEKFSHQYPHDKYLSGYARLYGLILRLNWDRDLTRVLEVAKHLEEDYAEDSVVPVMAGWYRTLLACFIQPKEAPTYLKDYAKKYNKKKEWFVVHLADRIAKDDRYRGRILDIVFFSPIRKPERLQNYYRGTYLEEHF